MYLFNFILYYYFKIGFWSKIIHQSQNDYILGSFKKIFNVVFIKISIRRIWRVIQNNMFFLHTVVFYLFQSK